MSLLPDILNVHKEGDCVTLQLHVRPDLAYFHGHFPGLPILPGVVQVDWAIRFGKRYFELPVERFSGLKALKFSAPVQQDAYLSLSLHWKPDAGRLDFSYTAKDRKFGAGQAVFLPKDVL